MARSPTPIPRPSRVSVLGGNGASYEVFDVVSHDDNKLVVKGPLLFEVKGNAPRVRTRYACS